MKGVDREGLTPVQILLSYTEYGCRNLSSATVSTSGLCEMSNIQCAVYALAVDSSSISSLYPLAPRCLVGLWLQVGILPRTWAGKAGRKLKAVPHGQQQQLSLRLDQAALLRKHANIGWECYNLESDQVLDVEVHSSSRRCDQGRMIGRLSPMGKGSNVPVLKRSAENHGPW